MNRHISRALLILCILAGIGGISANAQIESDVTVEANIPYTFVVGDTTLPAGKYNIKVLDDTDLNILEIRNANGHTAVMFETENVKAERTPRKTELVFDNVGGQYFLSQVWLSGSDSGAQVEKSRMERRLEAKGMKSERSSVLAQHRSSKAKKEARME